MGDVAHQELPSVDHSTAKPKSSLMKKLSLLLLPNKKSKSKSAGSAAAHKPPSAPLPQPSSGAGSELELLFAQAEATLGELLVRAGASFEARSSSYSHADPHHHPAARATDRSSSTGEDDVSPLIMGSSSGSRSAKFSGQQAHARRRSLSRVWQQLGGSLFCGSGHMSSYVMDHDMMPPEPSKGIYEDVVLDEAYWQSLADAMLLQQQGPAKLGANVAHCENQELSCRSTQEGQNDLQEHFPIAEEEDRVSEIVPSIDADSTAQLWLPERGSPSSTGRSSMQDMDSMYYRNLVGVESGGGCTRLNTTLDESPNLAHNYLTMKVGGTSSLLSRAEENPRRERDEVQVPAPVPSSSIQPLERFLWQARSVGGPSDLASGSASSPSSRSAPELLSTCQEPAESSATTSCRVSLMTLLHEEAAAVDSAVTLDARQEEEEAAEAAALLEEEGRRAKAMRPVAGEDPLLCCVCMIRRKGAALIPCGHTFCRTCAKQLFAGRGACPLCNNLIVQVLDIF